MRIKDFGEFIFEERKKDDPRYQYNEIRKKYEKGTKPDAIELDLSSHPSGEMTKLINEYVKTKEIFEEAKESHEAIKEILKNTVDASFDEQDIFITRYIKTKTYMFTFSKYTEAKKVEEKDYEKILNELVDLFPEIREGLEKIIDSNTKVKEIGVRSGAIKVSHIERVDEGVTDMLKGIFDKFKKLRMTLGKTLKRILGRIDRRFTKIDKLMEGIK